MRKIKNANMQKGLKKMGNKKTKVNTYVQSALENFRKYLVQERKRGGGAQFEESQINLEGLEKAIRSMSRDDREYVEKFWGLTGGVNHSEKMWNPDRKNVAFINLRERAHISVRKLSRLEYVKMYYNCLDSLVEAVTKKINKQGYSHISDFECVKYLMYYLVIVENGPKMSFEQDPMAVETKVDKMCYLDEYQALHEMCEAVKEFQDQSIKFCLIANMLEMMDLRDSITIRQNFGIEIPKDDLKLFRPNEIESIQTFGQIRDFKERVFGYGPWKVTCGLILGEKVEIEAFGQEIMTFCRDWANIEKYKSGQMKLKTSKELRILDIYNIGGLEFTDTYEIEFLYLMHQFI